MFMLEKPSTMPDRDFASVLTPTECSNPEVFVHVGLSTENCRWILHGTKQLSCLSNMTRGNGLVITILTCNLTWTPQGLGIVKDALITFCFTRVSCDIQIRQLINDIKCASASADCVTLCHSATVINIRIFDLKPLPTFLHNFIMFGSSLPAYF